eukprot:TRINITY_DN43663_c0_g1_i1.p1 TRINITY_DN43663_c0_g1~~TRINITY_DN43663_c0_g1_i1.p1  ORF type:complete len:814 (-),score=68.70 TRINITY_DN43663_c0_g1_i1:37-2478(-)
MAVLPKNLAVWYGLARFDHDLPSPLLQNRTGMMINTFRRTANIRRATLAVAELLSNCNATFWPLQGTLVALLRYGAMVGSLADGKEDAVDYDLEFAVEVANYGDWQRLGFECLLPSMGKESHRWNGMLNPNPVLGANQNFIYCSGNCDRTYPESRYDVLVQLYPYHVYKDPHGRKFLFRFSDEGPAAPAEVCKGMPKKYRHVAVGSTFGGWFPRYNGTGMMPYSTVHPLRYCEAYGRPIPCPQRPFEILWDTYGGSCFILPALTQDRQGDDPRNHKLFRAGLGLADLKVLGARARMLDAKGFASFLLPRGHRAEGLKCLRAAKQVVLSKGRYRFSVDTRTRRLVNSYRYFASVSVTANISNRTLNTASCEGQLQKFEAAAAAFCNQVEGVGERVVVIELLKGHLVTQLASSSPVMSLAAQLHGCLKRRSPLQGRVRVLALVQQLSIMFSLFGNSSRFTSRAVSKVCRLWLRRSSPSLDSSRKQEEVLERLAVAAWNAIGLEPVSLCAEELDTHRFAFHVGLDSACVQLSGDVLRDRLSTDGALQRSLLARIVSAAPELSFSGGVSASSCISQNITMSSIDVNIRSLATYDNRASSGGCQTPYGMWGYPVVGISRCKYTAVGELFAYRAGERVLDVGAGCGHGLVWLKERFNVFTIALDTEVRNIKHMAALPGSKLFGSSGQAVDDLCHADATAIEKLPIASVHHVVSNGCVGQLPPEERCAFTISVLSRLVSGGTLWFGWLDWQGSMPHVGEGKQDPQDPIERLRYYWESCFKDLSEAGAVAFEVVDEVRVFGVTEHWFISNSSYSLFLHKLF